MTPKDWQKKVLAVDPKDPEAAYTIGVIDWTKAHQNKLKALQAAGLNDDGKGNDEGSQEDHGAAGHRRTRRWSMKA